MDSSWWHQACRDFLLFVALSAAVCAIVQNCYLETELHNERNQMHKYKTKLESLEQQMSSLDLSINNQKGSKPSASQLHLRQARQACQCQGLKGSAGQRGPPGRKGDQGSQGIFGAKGEKGERGHLGFRGSKGEKGDANKGRKGQKGEKGLDADQLAQYAHVYGKFRHHPIATMDYFSFKGNTTQQGISVVSSDHTQLRVAISGIYFIYAQLSHMAHDQVEVLKYGLFLDGNNIANSSTSANNTNESKFIGLLKSVNKDQTISVRVFEKTHIHLRDSFFGAFCVSRT